ncbi:MAG TPA: DUF4833 domain-containing protein [Rhizomicrobium sp.]|jgi:hypothetical protein|nr:DUF4833 domain-containing protein [Rhizomicrobium sp.]
MKFCFTLLLAMLVALPAQARDFLSSVSESEEITRLRPEFKVPDEPNQLFYVQRSPNSNTVVYAAKQDARGNFDSRAPVEAFWRKFNIDGSRQPLNFIERMMAYGVRLNAHKDGQPVTFAIAALPQRRLTLSMDAQHHPQVTMAIGTRTVKVAYVYLQVVEGALLPSVPSLDIFGIDTSSGKAVHEHLIQK